MSPPHLIPKEQNPHVDQLMERFTIKQQLQIFSLKSSLQVHGMTIMIYMVIYKMLMQFAEYAKYKSKYISPNQQVIFKDTLKVLARKQVQIINTLIGLPMNILPNMNVKCRMMEQ